MLLRRGLSTIQTATGHVPIVDFGKFLKGNVSEKKSASEEVVNAFKNVGFVYLASHSIPQSQIDEVFGHSRRFFDLPLETKNKLAWISPEANRGYVAAGREKVTRLTDKEVVKALRDSNPDMKESMEIGKEPSSDFQNNWPSHDPAFRTTMLKFFNDCHHLHLEVMSSIATGLGLQPNFFLPFCDKRDHNLRLLHYPSVARPAAHDANNLARAGAHTDYGSITLLFQDSQGGLQVKTAAGQFQHAPPIPGTIVVNAGDMLSRWSNDVIRSTEHRVVAPPPPPPPPSNAAAAAKPGELMPPRHSVVMFCNPNWDAVIGCLDGCHSPQRPKAYAPIKCHDYLVQRLSATYS